MCTSFVLLSETRRLFLGSHREAMVDPGEVLIHTQEAQKNDVDEKEFRGRQSYCGVIPPPR